MSDVEPTPLEILRRDGWCKERLDDALGRRCALGAMAVAFPVESEQWDRFAAVLLGTIREQYGDMSIAAFNDLPATTFADIELVLEKAQLRYDEQVTA